MRGTIDWAAAGAEGSHIHYVVDDLGRFLTETALLDPAVNEATAECPSPIRSTGN
jgi:hypothetical protein